MNLVSTNLDEQQMPRENNEHGRFSFHPFMSTVFISNREPCATSTPNDHQSTQVIFEVDDDRWNVNGLSVLGVVDSQGGQAGLRLDSFVQSWPDELEPSGPTHQSSYWKSEIHLVGKVHVILH